MNEIIQELNIEKMIYEIRGKQVMLDSDLAKLYQCSNGTKSINLAVKRHINRFPERFMFQLTKEETEKIDLRFQFETSSLSDYGGRRYNPYAFTEQGVAMLATVLRTPVAEAVSIKIMDAFVAMRKYIASNYIESQQIINLVLKHDEQLTKHTNQIDQIFSYFESKDPVNDIYITGQVYDAYSRILDILLLAKEELIIIDSYADKYVLDMISKIKVQVTLVLSTNSRLSELDIDKYNKEYQNLTLIYNDSFHDRFIVLDKKKMYHLGTSLNNAGTKTFSINKVEDTRWLDIVLQEINIK